MQPVTRKENATITRRLLASMPASKFEMQTLCRLADIQTSRALPTAAVECKRRPRLLINPDFVERHCQRDEHLFLLVMHELWHVMLAHTRMYPRATTAQNIAFDAIINAGLMREFSQPEYMGFFDKINPADKFPGCLLRPPVGWPKQPEYPTDVGPPGTEAMIRRLYPKNNSRRYPLPLYEEVLRLLMKAGFLTMPMLIGNHDGIPEHDPLMKDMMRHVSANWPSTTFGQGMNGAMVRHNVRISSSTEQAQRVFSRTLQQCLSNRPGGSRRRAKIAITAQGGVGVLPNPHDRLIPAKRRLGTPSTLWSQPVAMKVRANQHPSRSFVYLDVSGSMNFILSNLLHLMLPYVARGEAEVFQFSTEVRPLPYAELRKGRLATTGGTSINCVLKHVLEIEPKVQRMLILTDGATGAPNPHFAQQLDDRGTKVIAVLPDGHRLDPRVEAITQSIVTLPPIHH